MDFKLLMTSYAGAVWNPHGKGIQRLEKVQMRATKLVYVVRHLRCTSRLNLKNYKLQRRCDMSEGYKILQSSSSL